MLQVKLSEIYVIQRKYIKILRSLGSFLGVLQASEKFCIILQETEKLWVKSTFIQETLQQF